MGLLPNLLGIGVQKAATSTLYSILQNHPSIAMSYKSEVHYFGMESVYQKGVEWYKKQFPHKENVKYRCEVSPGYINSKLAPKRILETLGSDVKFILILRNPVDRAYSNYNMERMAKRENRNFEKALLENKPSNHNQRYREKSLFGEQLAHFLEFFPLRNIHIIFFRNFITNQKEEVGRLCNFLDIKPLNLEDDIHRNQSGFIKYPFLQWIYNDNKFMQLIKDTINKYPAIKNGLKSKLQEKPKKLTPKQREKFFQNYFTEDVEHLENIIGSKIHHWHD